MTYEKLNEKSIVEFLMDIDILPENIKHNQAWYKAFYRGERTASLKVNIKKNVFYDFGEGFGGSTVQLAERIYGCRGQELMETISKHHSFSPKAISIQKDNEASQRESKMTYSGITQISHPALISYLKKRCIDVQIAQHFCKQVEYEIRKKEYFSIGFRNNQGGFELRNSIFKSCSSPKWFTHVKIGSERLAVFEGFFDFLTFLTLNKVFILEFDFLILNSISLTQKIESKLLEGYKDVALFLDNDSAGKKAVLKLQNISDKCDNFSFLYKEENDLNDWWMNLQKMTDFETKKTDFVQSLIEKYEL